MNEVGLSTHSINRKTKKVEIDFSGYEPEWTNVIGDKTLCLRNDASILFFVANSYWTAFDLISKELNKRFENEYNNKDIEQLVLPYYFNFRHFVELELKALIVALSTSSPETTHKLNVLANELSNLIKDIERDPKICSEQTRYIEAKEKSIYLCDKLKELIAKYCDIEFADEFFRYIFEKKNGSINLKHYVIKLNYCVENDLFNNIHELLMNICDELSSYKYIYNDIWKEVK